MSVLNTRPPEFPVYVPEPMRKVPPLRLRKIHLEGKGQGIPKGKHKRAYSGVVVRNMLLHKALLQHSEHKAKCRHCNARARFLPCRGMAARLLHTETVLTCLGLF